MLNNQNSSDIHNKISVLNNISPIILDDVENNKPSDLQKTLENLFIIAYNTAFSIGAIGQHTSLLNHIFVQQFRDKLQVVENYNNTETNITETVPQEESDGLKEQIVSNYTPICASVQNPLIPLYEPKTIVGFKNLKAYFRNQKQEDNILKQLNDVANLSLEERGRYMDSYIASRRITAKDCKKEKLPPVLIGQNGVYATRDIPAFTVLGYYSGIYFTTQEEIFEYIKQNGTSYKTYTFSFPDVVVPRVSAYLHGNDLSLVNAATIFTGTAHQIAREIYEKCNLTVIYAKSLEYPDADYVNDPLKYDLVAYASNRAIQKGEQLYVNYGMNYWRNRNDSFTTANEDEILSMMHYFHTKKMTPSKHKKR